MKLSKLHVFAFVFLLFLLVGQAFALIPVLGPLIAWALGANAALAPFVEASILVHAFILAFNFASSASDNPSPPAQSFISANLIIQSPATPNTNPVVSNPQKNQSRDQVKVVVRNAAKTDDGQTQPVPGVTSVNTHIALAPGYPELPSFQAGPYQTGSIVNPYHQVFPNMTRNSPGDHSGAYDLLENSAPQVRRLLTSLASSKPYHVWASNDEMMDFYTSLNPSVALYPAHSSTYFFKNTSGSQFFIQTPYRPNYNTGNVGSPGSGNRFGWVYCRQPAGLCSYDEAVETFPDLLTYQEFLQHFSSLVDRVEPCRIDFTGTVPALNSLRNPSCVADATYSNGFQIHFSTGDRLTVTNENGTKVVCTHKPSFMGSGFDAICNYLSPSGKPLGQCKKFVLNTAWDAFKQSPMASCQGTEAYTYSDSNCPDNATQPLPGCKGKKKTRIKLSLPGWGGIPSGAVPDSSSVATATAPEIKQAVDWTGFASLSFTPSLSGGMCPKPEFSAFGRSFTFDSVCNITDENRDMISLALLSAYSVLALFIVLKA